MLAMVRVEIILVIMVVMNLVGLTIAAFILFRRK